jgi:hypothetical protein
MALLAAELNRKWVRLLQERLDKTGGSSPNKGDLPRRSHKVPISGAPPQPRETLFHAYRYRSL